MGRLEADGALEDGWGGLVLGAFEGRAGLEAQLQGSAVSSRPVAPQSAPVAAGAFLRSVTVEGFRGIGRFGSLELAPGPGLTLVVGRNGSGKSSFAEALEVLLTGESLRWKDRAAVWRPGRQAPGHRHRSCRHAERRAALRGSIARPDRRGIPAVYF